MKHIRIRKANLPFERRIRLFRQYGILSRRLTDDDCWELLLPAGVVIVMNDNDNSSFWVFDIRKDVLIGVVEEYSDQEGGTLRLI